MGRYRAHHRIRDRSVVEARPAPLGDAFQSHGQFGLLEDRALDRDGAAGKEDRGRLGVRPQSFFGLFIGPDEVRIHGETVARELDGGVDQAFPRQAAPAFMDLDQAGDQPRDADRKAGFETQAADRRAVFVEEPIGGESPGSRLAEVQRRVRAVLVAIKQETSAAQTA